MFMFIFSVNSKQAATATHRLILTTPAPGSWLLAQHNRAHTEAHNHKSLHAELLREWEVCSADTGDTGCGDADIHTKILLSTRIRSHAPQPLVSIYSINNK